MEIETEEELRPVCVYKVPYGNEWNTENMGFYRSSGRGNDRFSTLYAETWMPFYGKNENGTIVKHSTLVQEYLPIKHQYLPWHMKLCKLLFVEGEIRNINDEIYNDSSTLPDNYRENENDDLIMFVTSYFSTWWQLQISASIGGGFWENPQIDGLRHFVLSHKIIKLSNLEVVFENDHHFTLNEVIIERLSTFEYWNSINDILIDNNALNIPVDNYGFYVNEDLNGLRNHPIIAIKQRFIEKIRMITMERRRKGRGKKHTLKMRKTHNSKPFSLGISKSKRRRRKRYLTKKKK